MHSNMLYGLSIWGLLVAKTCLKRVKILKKKAIRGRPLIIWGHGEDNKIILSCKIQDSHEIYNILTKDHLIDLECAKISYRFIHKKHSKSYCNVVSAKSQHAIITIICHQR